MNGDVEMRISGLPNAEGKPSSFARSFRVYALVTLIVWKVGASQTFVLGIKPNQKCNSSGTTTNHSLNQIDFVTFFKLVLSLSETNRHDGFL